MKILVLISLVCGLAACTMQDFQEYSVQRIEKNPYFMDPRTYLCFIGYDRSITYVPCTPEVMDEIERYSRRLPDRR